MPSRPPLSAESSAPSSPAPSRGREFPASCGVELLRRTVEKHPHGRRRDSRREGDLLVGLLQREKRERLTLAGAEPGHGLAAGRVVVCHHEPPPIRLERIDQRQCAVQASTSATISQALVRIANLRSPGEHFPCRLERLRRTPSWGRIDAHVAQGIAQNGFTPRARTRERTRQPGRRQRSGLHGRLPQTSLNAGPRRPLAPVPELADTPGYVWGALASWKLPLTVSEPALNGLPTVLSSDDPTWPSSPASAFSMALPNARKRTQMGCTVRASGCPHRRRCRTHANRGDDIGRPTSLRGLHLLRASP